MDWIRSRITEPTTWLAGGVGALVLSVAVPQGAFYFLVGAAVTAVVGAVLREKAQL